MHVYKNIRFKDKNHLDFFLSVVDSLGCQGSVHHQALFYLLGLTDETRHHLRDIYDFALHGVHLDALHQHWQTDITKRLTRLAFNLWSGWGEKWQEILATPYNLFDCYLAPYFAEAHPQQD